MDVDVEVDDSRVPSTQSSTFSKRPDASKRRSRVSSAFENRQCSSDRTELITQAAAQMIIINQLPLSFIESEGFNVFMKVVEPGYKIPCKKTILNRINLSYNEKKTCIVQKLASADSVALDTDSWTSLAMTSYITVNAHFINSDWQKEQYTIVTEEMSERHTITNLVSKLQNVTDDWGINNKILGVVTDNASNITGAVDLFDVEGGVRCFAHTLQLSIQKGFKLQEVKEVLDEASAVVMHFRHSSVATTALQLRQKQLGLPAQKLKQRCLTRWNSEYYMAMTLVNNKSAINTVLGDRSIIKQSVDERLHIPDAHWKVLEELVVFLKPLEVATTLMCSNKACTLSMVRPIVRSLLDAHLAPKEHDASTILPFKIVVATDITRRFKMEWEENEHINHSHIASALDPRYKDLRHERIDAREQIWNFLRSKLIDTESDNIDDHTSTTTREYESALDFLFQTQSSNKGSTQQQFNKYLNESTIEHNADPLKWWKLNESKFPSVAKLAKCYLSIPATSSSAERVFSTAGNIITAKRSCLHPKNVNMLVFLYQNRHIV